MPIGPFASRRAALRTALMLIALILVVVGLVLPSPTGERPAPPLPRTALNGIATTISQLHGHPAAVAFVASWCGPCHVEAPALERFATSASGRGRLVGIDDADFGNARALLIERYHWTFPVLEDQSGSTAAAYGVLHLPATVILNASGEIVARLSGAQTAASLERALRAAH
jgi:thiol-disulfide isomerase/thioredoxin